MGARGTKSAAAVAAEVASQSAVQGTLTRRLPPPRSLNQAGKRRWLEIVNEQAPDRFQASDVELLINMIRTEQYVAKCDRDIRKLKDAIVVEGKIHPLIGLREKHVKIMVLLQRALRLCPSMRIRHGAASLRGGRAKKKPWEV